MHWCDGPDRLGVVPHVAQRGRGNCVAITTRASRSLSAFAESSVRWRARRRTHRRARQNRHRSFFLRSALATLWSTFQRQLSAWSGGQCSAHAAIAPASVGGDMQHGVAAVAIEPYQRPWPCAGTSDSSSSRWVTWRPADCRRSAGHQTASLAIAMADDVQQAHRHHRIHAVLSSAPPAKPAC